jgi:hypothetical protein
MPALVAASARSKLELAALSIEANDMDMKKILAALGLGEDGTLEDALGAIKAYQEDGDKDEGKEQMKKLRKMLKLADDSPFEDVEAALKKLSVGGGDEDAGDKDPKRVVEEEASDDLNEDEKELAKMSAKVRGKFLALSSNVATLTKRLEKIERTQTVNEVEKLIADNTDKIPLHMEPFLRKQGAETVREFLKHAITSPRATPPKQKTNGGTEVTLTKEEKELAKLSGVTPEAQLQAKKERVERERAQQSQAD